MSSKILKISVFVCVFSLILGVITVKAEERKPITSQLKAKAETRLEKNREIRNIQIENRNIRLEDKNARIEERKDIKASTTMMFKNLKDQKRVVEMKMKVSTFEIRKNALVKELTMSLENLDRTKTRIADFITKAETNGRDMTKAKAQLVIANEKLAKAKVAVDAFTAFQFSTSNATSTDEISLDKPRKVGDEAIKAVKEARDSLKAVLDNVAKFMGKGDENKNATSTVPVSTSANTTSN